MKLEDEIIIVQFAQGHHAEVDLRNHFSQLTEADQRRRLFDLSYMLEQSRLTDTDIEQFNAQSASGNTSIPFLIMYSGKARPGLRINMAEGELENSFAILLNLFRKAYHHYGERGKVSPANWWFQDLSVDENVQGILTKNKERVNELYAAPSFRSEFISLARLWHDRFVRRQQDVQEPDSQEEIQTRFHFISYDGIMEKSAINGVDKTSHAIYILLNSLRKAITRQYGLDNGNSAKLVLDVMGKYYQASYTSQYDE